MLDSDIMRIKRARDGLLALAMEVLRSVLA